MYAMNVKSYRLSLALLGALAMGSLSAAATDPYDLKAINARAEKIDERPKGEGTGYYSCLLPIREPGAAPRMLLQYSHVYKAKRVNIAHRWITPKE